MQQIITLAATFTFVGLLQIASARGQVLENLEPAEIAKPQSAPVAQNNSPAFANNVGPSTTSVASSADAAIIKVQQSAQSIEEESAPAIVAEVSNVSSERVDEWDPWRPFNEKTFWFNRQFDRFLMKPVAVVYNAVLPGPVRQGISNSLDNLDVTRRVVHNVLQQDLAGAGREISRFVINSTAGVAGLFDVAETIGIQASDRDGGQTLGYYGVPNGPYLVLPFLPPFTVRDLIGYVADDWLYPLGFVVPLGAIIGLNVAGEIDTRAANIDTYLGVDENAPDLYGSVRSAYYQRRALDPSRK